MFYRIGDSEVVSLDPESVISRLVFQHEYLTVTFRDGHTVQVQSGQPDYAGYKQFMASCPLLVHELQGRSLRAIQMNYADPFLEEMPRTLFTAFQAFPGAYELELRLSDTGAGSVWTKGTHTHCILEWSDFQEGLQCLLQGNKTEKALAQGVL